MLMEFGCGFNAAARYVFPYARSLQRPMSNNPVLSALRRIDYDKRGEWPRFQGHGTDDP